MNARARLGSTTTTRPSAYFSKQDRHRKDAKEEDEGQPDDSVHPVKPISIIGGWVVIVNLVFEHDVAQRAGIVAVKLGNFHFTLAQRAYHLDTSHTTIGRA